ncbi:TonB-dependent receptor [Jiella sp. LLJ827]|nr:TonB-dependent receptor [Jiella sp. LLJ827]MCQ0988024.1 TonB-dependent receptor [Jiella sp. LLJ827]
MAELADRWSNLRQGLVRPSYEQMNAYSSDFFQTYCREIESGQWSPFWDDGFGAIAGQSGGKPDDASANREFRRNCLNYRVPSGQMEGVGVGAGVRYFGESFADNQNQFEVPDVTLVDARIAYEKDDWGVSLNVNNVFDKKHVASCQGATACYYGEGRRGLLKAHFKF